VASLSVFLEDDLVATVSTEGLDVASVRVSGSKIDADVAALDISGGSYPEDGEPKSLIWVDGLALRKGQAVRVSFCADGASSHPGETIQELHPYEESLEPPYVRSNLDLCAELEAAPVAHETAAFQIEFSDGATFLGERTASDHGFGFKVMWSDSHPEAVSVSLHTYTLGLLDRREDMSTLVKRRMTFGESVLLVLTE
jgi:hypothetical protein